MYYFKYHPGEKETVKIMEVFYVTQKVLGEKVQSFKREVTKEQTDKLRADILYREKSFALIFLLILQS